MKCALPLLYFAQGIICQVNSPVASIGTPSIISSSTAPKESATPTFPASLPPNTATSTRTPTIPITSSPSASTDTKSLTQLTSSVSTKSSSITTVSASSNSTVTDDEAEVTITGKLAPETTGEIDFTLPLDKPRELTPDESVALIALELETYADLLVNAPLEKSPDDPAEGSVIALPACPVSAASLAKRALFDGKKAPDRPPFYPCMQSSLSIEVVYNYVPDSVMDPADREILKARVSRAHAHFVKVMKIFGIELRNGGFTHRKATDRAVRFSNHYLSDVNSAENRAALEDQKGYRKATRVGGVTTLNVWIVKTIVDEKGDITAGGYASFPEWRDPLDGIVMMLDALRNSDDKVLAEQPSQRGTTLIHEFGHWMGLRHTFGDSDCTRDDGIADTMQTSNSPDTRRNEFQHLCGRPKERPQWIFNYMSYSRVRATSEMFKPLPLLKAFTPGQRAAMFARYYAFRTGVIYNGKFCDKSLNPRSDIPDHVLHRRAEDKAKVLADLLLNNCSIAIQDVYLPDTIPLPKSLLASYSSVASSMVANPTSNTNMFAPKTATIGTGTAVPEPTANGGSTGGANPDKSGKKSAGHNLRADGVAAFLISAVAFLVLGITFI